MDTRIHWENVYRNKAPEAVSWYRPHLDRSVELIAKACPGHGASIVDVGGGASTLVDDLLAKGYSNVTVLDISQTALDAAQNRLGKDQERVRWICGDILAANLPACSFDLWHDRAVFHFLTAPEDRIVYVRAVEFALKPGGHAVLGTFGPEGPRKCSGLDTMRYDAETLSREFGEKFQLVESPLEIHQTPSGTTQQFVYCHFRRLL